MPSIAFFKSGKYNTPCEETGKLTVSSRFRVLGDKRNPFLLILQLTSFNRILDPILSFLIPFRNDLLIAFQLSGTFGLRHFTALCEFSSILSERSFKYKFEDLSYYFLIITTQMIKTLILESRKVDLK